MTGGRAAYFGATVLIRAVVQSGSTLSVLVIGKYLGPDALVTYSVCLAAVWLASLIFHYGAPVIMRRFFIVHSDLPALTVYRRILAAVFRSPHRYSAAGGLLLCLAAYINHTVGNQAVVLLVLLSPLTFVVPFLSIKFEYHRALGHAIPASLFEPSSVHIGITVLVAISIFAGLSDLNDIFSVGFIFFLAIGGFTLMSVLRATRGMAGLSDPASQRKILANTLLMFLFRNGFPLFFAAFMLVSDLGHFRLEERLFYLLLFFYMLFETLGMKSIIAAFKTDDGRASLRFYMLAVAQITAIGLVSALLMYAGLSNRTLTGLIGYTETGGAVLLMALATPFYFLIYFNNLVLNLLGHHGRVVWSLLAVALAFIAGAYALYPVFGIDGVRAAYLCGGIIGSALSGRMILLALRKPAPEADSIPE